jgi:hypothetical protein
LGKNGMICFFKLKTKKLEGLLFEFYCIDTNVISENIGDLLLGIGGGHVAINGKEVDKKNRNLELFLAQPEFKRFRCFVTDSIDGVFDKNRLPEYEKEFRIKINITE